MSEQEKNAGSLGRRQFLRSIFGLGSIAEAESAAAESAAAKEATTAASRFFWASLKRGQIGFPCGHSVPEGMPGSIMKLVSAAALLDTRVLLPDDKLECRGVYRLHNESYKCLQAHGMVDIVHAIGMSCNVFFAKASQKLSSRALLEYAKKFGLADPVAGFDSGKFPETSASTSSDRYVLGLAPDLEPQALQILRVACLVANEGKLPYLHSAECPDENGKTFELELSKRIFGILKDGMKLAAREGTGKKLDPENKLHLAIKTGTTPHGKTFQSWICGYFPYDDPRYAFVLRAASGTSYDQAVPQARSFLFSAEWPLD